MHFSLIGCLFICAVRSYQKEKQNELFSDDSYFYKQARALGLFTCGFIGVTVVTVMISEGAVAVTTKGLLGANKDISFTVMSELSGPSLSGQNFVIDNELKKQLCPNNAGTTVYTITMFRYCKWAKTHYSAGKWIWRDLHWNIRASTRRLETGRESSWIVTKVFTHLVWKDI